ncbi:flavin depend monooxygenase that catalyses the oxidation of rubrofusarin to 9-hydroxyrubrofusarin [Colletotrichum asianum]
MASIWVFCLGHGIAADVNYGLICQVVLSGRESLLGGRQPRIESAAVQSLDGASGAVGPNKVELTDGKVIKVDTIKDWLHVRLLSFGDPTRETTPDWAVARGSRSKPLPRLYQGVFLLSHPHSLAFQGAVELTMGHLQIHELSSMEVTQVRKGRPALPHQEEM